MLAAPLHGIGEDPATGSSVAPLSHVLYLWRKLNAATRERRVEQGTKMGRKSFLHAGFEQGDG